MKTKQRAFVILLALTLAFTAGLLLLSVQPGNVQDAPVYREMFVTDLNVAEVGAVTVENEKGRFGLLAETAEIEMIAEGVTEEEATAAFSQAEMRSFLYTASHLTALRRIDNRGALADYGHDQPRATVTLLKRDRSTLTYLILNDAETGQGTYCYAEAEDALYLIDASDAALFLRGKEDFVTHTLFPALSAADCVREVRSIRVRAGDASYEITSDGSRFTLQKPFVQKLRTSVVYGDLIAALSSLYAERTVASTGGFAAMGITEADLEVTMETRDERYSARFSFDGERCLAEVPETGFVYAFATEEIRMLPQDALTLLQNRAFYYALGDLRSMEVQTKDNSAYFVFTGSGEEIAVSAGNATLSPEDAIALSDALNNVAVSSLAGEDAALLSGTPVLTLQMLLHDGTQETLSFLRFPDGLSDAVFSGDVCNFTVRAADTDALTETLFALASAAP